MRSKVAWHATSSCVYCIFHVWSCISSCVYCISATSKLPFGLSWGLLFSMLVGLWSFMGILWVQNEVRNIKMRVSKAILADVEVARGSQRLSMGWFWEDVHHLFCALLYFGMFFVSKVLRIATFLKVLDVVKAAPQARPKTTWRAC